MHLNYAEQRTEPLSVRRKARSSVLLLLVTKKIAIVNFTIILFLVQIEIIKSHLKSSKLAILHRQGRHQKYH